MSKTKIDLVKEVLEELFVLEDEQVPEPSDQAVILRKIEEVMPEVERRGIVTGWRGNAIGEIYMGGLATLVAARSCRKFVTDAEIPLYEGRETFAWSVLSTVSSEPYKARPTRASHI